MADLLSRQDHVGNSRQEVDCLSAQRRHRKAEIFLCPFAAFERLNVSKLSHRTCFVVTVSRARGQILDGVRPRAFVSSVKLFNFSIGLLGEMIKNRITSQQANVLN